MTLYKIEERIAEIEKRLAAVPGGIWYWRVNSSGDHWQLVPAGQDDPVLEPLRYSDEYGISTSDEVAMFLACAPDDIRWLLDIAKFYYNEVYDA